MDRLNKVLAHAGIGSRRRCDQLILAGRVKIDGKRVTEIGIRVDPAQHKLSVDDAPITMERFVYWAVNKPEGVVCTNHDPDGRTRAVDLIPHVEQRVYTVGRLDAASEGLLIMTNDGDLANQLTHPRYGVEKTYAVQVAGSPTQEDLDRLLKGVFLAEGKVQAKSVRRMRRQGNSTWLQVVLSEGKNREIRRMLAKLDHKVMTLRRTAIGPVYLEKLAAGKCRKLSGPEISALKNASKSAAASS